MPKSFRFEIYKDARGQYRFRLVEERGEILLNSPGYATKEQCLKEINEMKKRASQDRREYAERVDSDEHLLETPPSQKIFIVHGKDENNMQILKSMLSGWGLKPIVLAEQTNRGRTIIEKLLDHTSDVGYAFVLMTPDDRGALESELAVILDQIKHSSQKSEALSKLDSVLKSRVRQNVVFEYGLCVGSLGRRKICPLVKKGDIEIPTDILGYGYHAFADKVSESEMAIRNELEAAGYRIAEL